METNRKQYFEDGEKFSHAKENNYKKLFETTWHTVTITTFRVEEALESHEKKFKVRALKTCFDLGNQLSYTYTKFHISNTFFLLINIAS